MARAMKKNREIDCGMESPAETRRSRKVSRFPEIEKLLMTNNKIK
jgi:hypothetical protein